MVLAADLMESGPRCQPFDVLMVQLRRTGSHSPVLYADRNWSLTCILHIQLNCNNIGHAGDGQYAGQERRGDHSWKEILTSDLWDPQGR